MAGHSLYPVPVYTPEELDEQRSEAVRRFIEERLAESGADYRAMYEKILPAVARLFQATDNLTGLNPAVLAADPKLLDSLRFLAGPPISEDDLNTLAQRPIAKRRKLSVELAQAAVQVLSGMIDTIRCPWIAEQRQPGDHEVAAAIRWTAGLMAVERLRTTRRTESAARQQEAVRRLLLDHGWTEVHVREIRALDDLPRGSFSGEAVLGGNKCDVPIRLKDGRLLAVECKVSNSAINSVKRLIRETAGKAAQWKNDFGNQVITAAVLSGVFKLANLLDAQKRGVAIFWEHDLARLWDFVENAV